MTGFVGNVERARETLATPSVKRTGPAGGQRETAVLVADDELLVSEIFCDVIRDMGHTITGSAEDAQRAVELAQSSRADIRLP